jgi:hypothetical protein
MKVGVGVASHHGEGEAKKLSISSIQAYVPLETKKRAWDEKTEWTERKVVPTRGRSEDCQECRRL